MKGEFWLLISETLLAFSHFYSNFLQKNWLISDHDFCINFYDWGFLVNTMNLVCYF